MNWIKKNPAQLSLAVAAVITMASAFALYSNSQGFADQFNAAHSNPSEDNKIPETDTKVLIERLASLDKPVVWLPKSSSLFVSDKYLVKDGKLVNPFGKGGEPLHAGVPNEVILKYGIDITAANILDDDLDKDGFDFRLEYAGLDGVQTTQPPVVEPDATDPTKAESHPPYHTRLSLVRIHKVPFRLIFRAYDYNAKTKACTIQINPIDRGGRTVFVDLGQEVPNTGWKFESFELKDTGDKDVSVANMVNMKTGQKLALVNNVMGDSPESFAVFTYKWVAPGGQPTKDFFKRKDETFVLDPEPDKNYKVIDIREKEVDVQLPSGEKKTYVLTVAPAK
jgi:hypothetical protein